MLNGLAAGWYDGKGVKETVVVVGCVKRVWVVACGFLPDFEPTSDSIGRVADWLQTREILPHILHVTALLLFSK